MKNKGFAVVLLIMLSIVFLTFAAVGCDNEGHNFLVSGQSTTAADDNIDRLSDTDIKNLVTDDDKLVINYYDAYKWVVNFADSGDIEYMMYIYEFDDIQTAEGMLKTRQAELELNNTMTIMDSYSIDRYVVIKLTDTSFTGVSRNILEYNFSQLIIR